MRLRRFQTVFPALLGSLLVASGCANTVVDRVPIYPPSADLTALAEPKPAPTDAILTSEIEAAKYDADVELWGDRLHDAGVRVCKWAKANGLKIVCE